MGLRLCKHIHSLKGLVVVSLLSLLVPLRYLFNQTAGVVPIQEFILNVRNLELKSSKISYDLSMATSYIPVNNTSQNQSVLSSEANMLNYSLDKRSRSKVTLRHSNIRRRRKRNVSLNVINNEVRKKDLQHAYLDNLLNISKIHIFDVGRCCIMKVVNTPVCGCW